MRVQFTDDEVATALTVLVNAMGDTAGLADKDRAMLKRWRASKMKLGSDDMNDLVHKANEDLKKGLERRERSQIRKPDWVD